MAIMSQPSRISEPFAGSGTKNAIPDTNTTPNASQAASWASGFPPECSQPISAGGCPVPRNDFNGVLNQLSQDYAFRQDGGIWEWSAFADYAVQRIVRGSDGLLYYSKAQSGPGVAAGAQDPVQDSSRTYWTAVPTNIDALCLKSGKNEISYYSFAFRDTDDDVLVITGGKDVNSGAQLDLHGPTYTGGTHGSFVLRARDSSDTVYLIGNPSGTLTWNGQTVQTTSDERLKTPLSAVPDEVLDAWEAVGWGQFRYRDAVARKGPEEARLHLGLIAQRVKAVFEERGLDACDYGILCHEDSETIKDLWMVRYAEAQAMEACCQRRRADRAEARLAALEEKLAAIEAKLSS